MLPAAPYDTDIALWTTEQAGLLRDARFAEVDLSQVAREIEGIAARQSDALRGHLADAFPAAYHVGRSRAAAESGVDLPPPMPPFTLAQGRDEAFMPVEPDRETFTPAQ